MYQQHQVSGAKEMRERCGLTLEQAAQAAQVTTKTIWRLESRKFKRGPRDETLMKIAAVYHCTIEDLRATAQMHDGCKGDL